MLPALPTATKRLPLKAMPLRSCGVVPSGVPTVQLAPASLGIAVITGVLGPAGLSALVAFITNAYCVPFARLAITRGDWAVRMIGTPGAAGVTLLAA